MICLKMINLILIYKLLQIDLNKILNKKIINKIYKIYKTYKIIF